MWSGIWSVATTRIDFWTWIWSVDWDRKWLVDFNAGKIQLVSFDWPNNTGAIVVKIDGSDLEEKSSFKMLGLTLSSKLDWRSYIISTAKPAPWKLEPWFILWSFFFLRLLCISINLPYAHAWNIFVMSGLLFLVATWNYRISYKNKYTGLLVLYLLPLLNHWLIIKM